MDRTNFERGDTVDQTGVFKKRSFGRFVTGRREAKNVGGRGEKGGETTMGAFTP